MECQNIAKKCFHLILFPDFKVSEKGFSQKEMLDRRNDFNENLELDFIKNPTILEFLNLPEYDYAEKDLEKCFIQNMKKFLEGDNPTIGILLCSGTEIAWRDIQDSTPTTSFS